VKRRLKMCNTGFPATLPSSVVLSWQSAESHCSRELDERPALLAFVAHNGRAAHQSTHRGSRGHAVMRAHSHQTLIDHRLLCQRLETLHGRDSSSGSIHRAQAREELLSIASTADVCQPRHAPDGLVRVVEAFRKEVEVTGSGTDSLRDSLGLAGQHLETILLLPARCGGPGIRNSNHRALQLGALHDQFDIVIGWELLILI